jgi:hypothetical protein
LPSTVHEIVVGNHYLNKPRKAISMKVSLLVLTLAVSTAYAGNQPTEHIPGNQSQKQWQDQSQLQNQGQAQNLIGGPTNQSFDAGRSNLYILPGPVSSTPLPPMFCPKGDSLAWSIGWNFFSYAVSTTRTELECLEKYVEVAKALNPAPVTEQIIMAPKEPIHPSCTTVPHRVTKKPVTKCK